MSNHSRKYEIESYLGIDFDASVYSSGGSSFSVEVENVVNGSKKMKSFAGKDAKARAISYARKVSGNICED